MAAINWSGMTDLGQLPAAANTASNGSFWAGMVFMIWIVLILVMIGWGWEVAILAASGVVLMLAVLLSYAGLVAWYVVITFLAIILFMFAYITYSGSRK